MSEILVHPDECKHGNTHVEGTAELECPLCKCANLQSSLERLTKERDSLQRHYDAAAPEHNLLALLDLYDDRARKAEQERDRLATELATLEKYVEHNNDEYRTMKEVLRAEHQECERMRPVYEAATHLHSTEIQLAFRSDLARVKAEQALASATRAAIAAEIAIDDPGRCAVCGWALVDAMEQGCVPGNCSYRPRPKNLYSPKRAEREAITHAISTAKGQSE